MRKSTITTSQDQSGEYEIELFDHPAPKRVIVCSHGNGARRWDGEEFFYRVAEHYADSAVLLADQNQPDGDAVKINPLPILVERLQSLIAKAQELYAGVPIIVVAHSMGCGVTTLLDLTSVKAIIFVAPATGTPQDDLIKRYGQDIVHGKTVKSSDGLTKIISAEYYHSLQGINWEDEYIRLAKGYSPTYVFEAGNEEILADSHFQHRAIPFTNYQIIKGAKHNFSGQPLQELFQKMDQLLEQ